MEHNTLIKQPALSIQEKSKNTQEVLSARKAVTFNSRWQIAVLMNWTRKFGFVA